MDIQIWAFNGRNFYTIFCNDRKEFLQSFEAVLQLQAELHFLKAEKLDACIRPLFANPVTFTG